VEVVRAGGHSMSPSQLHAIQRHLQVVDQLTSSFPTPHWRKVILEERDYILAHGVWRVAEERGRGAQGQLGREGVCPCPTIHCPALHCPGLFCRGLHCRGLHCCGLHCPALHCRGLHCLGLHCPVLVCTVLCTDLACTVLACTVLVCTVLCTVLACTVLVCIVGLHCPTLHCTALQCVVFWRTMRHGGSCSLLLFQLPLGPGLLTGPVFPFTVCCMHTFMHSCLVLI
jgi:hypothetical protein